MLPDGGDNAHTTFRGHRFIKIWKSKKRAKFGRFYDNFRVSAKISLEPMKIATKSKGVDENDLFGFENCEIPSTTNKVISVHVKLP